MAGDRVWMMKLNYEITQVIVKECPKTPDILWFLSAFGPICVPLIYTLHANPLHGL